MPLSVSSLPGAIAPSRWGRTVVGMALFWLGTGAVSASDGWVDRRGEPVAEAAVLERLERSDIILLGEVHDSADIHARQVELLESLGNSPLVLALEQLDLDRKAELSAEDGVVHVDGRELAEAAGFDDSGWGWEHYGAIFSLAARQGWPLRPINLSREAAREIARDSGDWRLALTAEQVDVLDAFAPGLSLPQRHQEALVADLIEVHCGDLDRSFARRIARAQVARDVLMADAILATREEFPGRQIVAIMGNQHARLDRGAGYWIEQMVTDRMPASRPTTISVGMLPLGKEKAEGLMGRVGDQYDLRLPTEAVDRPPNCDEEPVSSSSPNTGLVPADTA